MYMVEVGNGEGQIGAGGYYPSYEQYIMALDKGWHVAPTNNQDNHKGRWGNANDARDVILTDDFYRRRHLCSAQSTPYVRHRGQEPRTGLHGQRQHDGLHHRRS